MWIWSYRYKLKGKTIKNTILMQCMVEIWNALPVDVMETGFIVVYKKKIKV